MTLKQIHQSRCDYNHTALFSIYQELAKLFDDYDLVDISTEDFSFTAYKNQVEIITDNAITIINVADKTVYVDGVDMDILISYTADSYLKCIVDNLLDYTQVIINEHIEYEQLKDLLAESE